MLTWLLVNPIGLEDLGWRYYIVYIAILVVESLIAYGWFIETQGKTLEEIAVLFDGDQADVAVPATKNGAGVVELVEDENTHPDGNTKV